MKQASDRLMTKDGWLRLHEELSALQKRREAKMADFAHARSADPDESLSSHLRSELALLDTRISQLRAMLDQAVLVDSNSRQHGEVGIGSMVLVSWDDGDEESYVVVGSAEVNLNAKRISYESPVGQALMGRREGERVEVVTPAGLQRLRVVSVE